MLSLEILSIGFLLIAMGYVLQWSYKLGSWGVGSLILLLLGTVEVFQLYNFWFEVSIVNANPTNRFINALFGNYLAIWSCFSVYSLRKTVKLNEVKEELQEEAAHFRSVVETADHGIVTMNLSGEIRFLNSSGEKLFGVREVAVQGESILDFFSPESSQRIQSTLKTFREEGDAPLLEQSEELEGQTKDGKTFPLEVALSSWSVRNQYYITAELRDLTERKAIEESLRKKASHDSLTGLPNRNLFSQQIEHAIERTKREEDFRAAVVFLDLNDFKRINDSFGHSVGDRVLKTVAERMEETVRGVDKVGRWGGDEFMILLGDIDNEEDLMSVLSRIQDALEEPTTIQAHTHRISASIGVTWVGPDASPEQLINQADTAMYHGRDENHNKTIVFYEEEMKDQARTELQLRADLRKALERDEFVLYFQPLVSLSDRNPIGAETLLRWDRPVEGICRPGTFLPAIQNSELLIPVGNWVFRNAVEQLQHWHQEGLLDSEFFLSVNRSIPEIHHDGFMTTTESILKETAIDPSHLSVELTEKVLAEDSDLLRGKIESLKDLGIGITIDDFGSGYASFEYLIRWAPEILKIDQSFITDLSEEETRGTVVRNMIRFGNELSLPLLAEGVETQKTADLLERWDCTMAQGYHFGRPLPAEEFTNRYLRSNDLSA